jgi:5'-nucleotidase (lipoprotein e(P4) family)
MHQQVLWLVLTLFVFTVGCLRNDPMLETAAGAHEDLDATVWMRTSAEFEAIFEQTFASARKALDLARKDPKLSALPDQAEHLAKQPADVPELPTAVIVDVDETVLDTSAYQVDCIESGEEYSVESFDAWVQKGTATPLPGAQDFVRYCRESGVEVFYVTNRTVGQERATTRNLIEHGLMAPDIVDHLLTKDERDDWGTDKETRRKFLADRFRILLVIGDDLNDFISTGIKPAPQARTELASRHREAWGKFWFMLPNANYGGWERAVYGFDDTLPREQKIEAKRRSLRPHPKTEEESPK